MNNTQQIEMVIFVLIYLVPDRVRIYLLDMGLAVKTRYNGSIG